MGDDDVLPRRGDLPLAGQPGHGRAPAKRRRDRPVLRLQVCRTRRGRQMDDLRQEQRDRACRGRHHVEPRRRKQALRGQRHSESDPFVGPHVPATRTGTCRSSCAAGSITTCSARSTCTTDWPTIRSSTSSSRPTRATATSRTRRSSATTGSTTPPSSKSTPSTSATRSTCRKVDALHPVGQDST